MSTNRERLRNIQNALAEHDSDCAHRLGEKCDCGAADFKVVDVGDELHQILGEALRESKAE